MLQHQRNQIGLCAIDERLPFGIEQHAAVHRAIAVEIARYVHRSDIADLQNRAFHKCLFRSGLRNHGDVGIQPRKDFEGDIAPLYLLPRPAIVRCN